MSDEDNNVYSCVSCRPKIFGQKEIVYNEVDDIIGSGVFGVVYRCKLASSGEVVAVKRLVTPHHLKNSDLTDFISEVNILQRLTDCQYIIRFLGMCIDPGHYAIVMEYVENGNLEDMLLNGVDNHPIIKQWNCRIRMALEIAKGVNYLHSLPTPIIHRDLKTTNVLVGCDYGCKIIDFGLAKVRGISSKQTTSGYKGTVAFAAPEIFSRKIEKGKEMKVDVYSYAIILWQLKEMQPLYAAESPCVVQANVVAGERPPISDNDYLEGYKEIIVRCWNGQPDCRPQFKKIVVMLDGIMSQMSSGSAVSYLEAEDGCTYLPDDPSVDSRNLPRPRFNRSPTVITSPTEMPSHTHDMKSPVMTTEMTTRTKGPVVSPRPIAKPRAKLRSKSTTTKPDDPLADSRNLPRPRFNRSPTVTISPTEAPSRTHDMKSLVTTTGVTTRTKAPMVSLRPVAKPRAKLRSKSMTIKVSNLDVDDDGNTCLPDTPYMEMKSLSHSRVAPTPTMTTNQNNKPLYANHYKSSVVTTETKTLSSLPRPVARPRNISALHSSHTQSSSPSEVSELDIYWVTNELYVESTDEFRSPVVTTRVQRPSLPPRPVVRPPARTVPGLQSAHSLDMDSSDYQAASTYSADPAYAWYPPVLVYSPGSGYVPLLHPPVSLPGKAPYMGEQASGQHASGRPPDENARALQGLKATLREWDIDPSKFCLKKIIGEGAFGKVWLATANDLPQKSQVTERNYMCAVKLLKDQEGKTRQSKEIIDFLQEAEIMSQFHHGNVTRLVAVNISREPFMIFSEYMNKGDLKTLMKEDRLASKEWPLEMKLRCAVQTAYGLEHLVEKLFVHRDVAARNVLVHEERPGYSICKLTDFGLSRAVCESDYYRIASSKNTRLPVKWMSIESLEDSIFDHKTDVWSFGVLLWEIFSMAIMPYDGVSNRDMLPRLKKGLRLLKPRDCIAPIHDLIMRCTSRLSKNRPTISQICRRLIEEHEVARDEVIPERIDERIDERSDTLMFSKRVRSLSHRMSLSDIAKDQKIKKLKRNVVEDILHSNFVSFTAADDLGSLVNKLRELWKNTKDEHCD